MRTSSKIALGALALALVSVNIAAPRPSAAPRQEPVRAGRAAASTARLDDRSAALANNAITAEFDLSTGRLRAGSIRTVTPGAALAALDEAFTVTFTDGRTIKASQMALVGKPRIEPLAADLRASRLAERVAGQQVVIDLRSADPPFGAVWRAVLRDGSTYIRQEVALGPSDGALSIGELVLVDAAADGAAVSGSVPGSPVVTPAAFMGVEHPMSACAVDAGRVHCGLKRALPLNAGQQLVASSVVGLAPAASRRRAVLAYLERERAHPYRTFLHYNSWYDIGYFTPYDEAAALDVIAAYGRELVRARGVTLDSFLFDDGWDDQETLWAFGRGFPRGFARVKDEAARLGAAPGVWLSPWGGYGKPREQRLAFGKAQGFETNERGFALSGPVYYKRFRDTCLRMVREFGANQFKFDGIGRATGTVPGSEFGSDFEAAIHLIGELRAAAPDIYVNLTTGTWPSPFWLRYADSIWRGGEDHNFAGVGSSRQRWITYRDAQTYKNVVTAGPLFPINALMLHGLIYARHAKDLDTDPQGDFTAEIRSYFGTGTQLQEMYVTPSLLKEANWTVLAEAAKWSRANASVLVDAHWVGGDPSALDVYGWAAWSPDKAILVLRNPADHPASFSIDVGRAFELPAGAPTRYSAHSPWKEDAARPPIALVAGTPWRVELKPFEVVTLDATPAR